MIVQVSEITSVDEALRIAKMGVDHVGVVVGDGLYEGELRPFKAREIFLSLPSGVKGVAFTKATDLDEINTLVKETGPDILHLAGNFEEISPGDIEAIKKLFANTEIMRTIPVVGEESVVAAMMFDGICDYLMLETKDMQTGKVGGTGVAHDWDIDKKIVESVSSKVILSGGIGPGNVQEAIKVVKPYGVASKTSTDKLGGRGKDIIKVKLFVNKAKSVIVQ